MNFVSVNCPAIGPTVKRRISMIFLSENLVQCHNYKLM